MIDLLLLKTMRRDRSVLGVLEPSFPRSMCKIVQKWGLVEISMRKLDESGDYQDFDDTERKAENPERKSE